MAHHEGSGADRSADDEYLAVPGSSYEHTDANVWAVVKFSFWLVVLALLVHVGMGAMYGTLVEGAKETGGQRYPLATGGVLPPEPQLQESPAAEIRQFRSVEEQRLHGYGWVDKEAGIVHIPIEEAMRLMGERGLPVRAEAPGLVTSPGMLATDASAGRVMERRRP
jgi:hypothetical protein